MRNFQRTWWGILIAAYPVLAFGQTLEKKTLSLEGAKKIASAAEAFAKQHGAGGTLAIVDDGGNLMYLQRMDGSFPGSAKIAIGKARTSALFKKPTSFFENAVNKGRTVMVALEDFTPLQGGVPIEVDGQVVGAIGVSGAASAQQDEEMALAGAAALKSAGTTAGKPAGTAARTETGHDASGGGNAVTAKPAGTTLVRTGPGVRLAVAAAAPARATEGQVQ